MSDRQALRRRRIARWPWALLALAAVVVAPSAGAAPPEAKPEQVIRKPRVLKLPDGVRLPAVPPSEAPAAVNLKRQQAVQRVLESLVPRAQAMALRPEVGDEPPREARTNEGWLRSVGAPPGRAFAAAHLAPRNDPAAAAANFMRLHGEAFGVAKEGVDFRSERVKSRDGRQFVRLGQDFSGIPVYGASVVVQLDAVGDVEFVLSDVARDDARFHQKEFATRPMVGADAARALALTVPDLAPQAPDLVASEPVLMIYEPSVIGNAGNSRLVWHVRVTSEALPVDEVVLVDARTGELAFHFSQIMEAKSRQIYDCNNVLDSTGSLARSEGQAATGNTDVDLAYDYFGDTYGFYWSHLGRDSIDGAGMTMIGRVRYCQSGDTCPYKNAFWNGSETRFGQGYATADDVVGHELTHGVTQHESGLIYWSESGAINESLSDIFGEFIDQTNGKGNDTPGVLWYFGEDGPGGASRYMLDPPNPPSPCYPVESCSAGYNPRQPDRRYSGYWYNGDLDKRGVHVNSGVGNKLAYLLTDGDTFYGQTITGMGIDAVADLFYTAQISHSLLPSAADYFDLYSALTQAAINREWTTAQRANLERACRAVQIAVSGNVTTIFSDGFEGSFPGSWMVTTGGTQWGRSTYRKASGGASAWCAAGGTYPQPSGGPYAPNMNTWMVYGPFSLADANQAWIEFDFYLKTDAGFDKAFWGVSVDGSTFYGDYVSPTDTGGITPPGWVHELANLGKLGGVTVLGQPQVWVAFQFYSDSIYQYEGAYIDNVVIQKTVCAAPSSPTLTAPASASSSANYTVSWAETATSPLDTYDLQEATDASFTSPTTYAVTGTSWTFNHTVGSDTTYYYRVRATDSCGGSAYNSSWSNTGQTLVRAPRTLTVSRAGTGTGTVTSSPAGINCGSTCSTSFDYNTVVTLSASASTGSTFAGWSGACVGTGSCQVTMDQAYSVTATFTLISLSVSKSGTGTGTVTSSPAGINCGSTCSTSFDYNTVVTLSASAGTGSTFTGWSGEGCSGTGTCQVTMSQARSVTATFTLNTYSLSVSKSGTGTGTVTSSPAGITCGATCSTSFTYNTGVTLSASADTGSTFTGWSGEGCSGTGSCQVTMIQARSVTATFTLNTYSLSVSKSGTGTGTVTSSPSGIDCGSTCSAGFDYNTVVTLSAAASTGSTFSGWSGESCSGTSTCQVTMSQARAVTATFALVCNSQFIQQGDKLVGSGAVGAAVQGSAVALSADGNTTIVGGPNDNGGIGAAWVFTRSGGVWTQQGSKLVGSGAAGNAGQGHSVALSADGNTAIVGGPGDNGGIGAAWVFTRSGGVWTQEGSKLVGTGAVGSSVLQGISVALSADGNTAVVGGDFDAGYTGAAWVFTRSDGVWTQQGSKLVGTGAVGHAYQGNSVGVSADGNTAIVGGYADNINIGAAWVFTRSDGVWTQEGSKLVGTGTVAAAAQGTSVALSADGNTAIVGGESDNTNAGAVWAFTRSGGVWTQQGSKLVGTGAEGPWGAGQGFSVALSADGNTAIVGGQTDNSDAGATWVFTRSAGVWTQLGDKLVGAGALGAAHQGRAVALSADGNTAVVGGFYDDSHTGAAWVFMLPNSLTVNKAGTGTGTVTSSPAGIDCGSVCSFCVEYNTVVTLSAVAGTGSTFTGWSGEGCSGSGTCQVTMSQARTVTAAFTLNTYSLSVSKSGTGTGTVTSSPAGINCGSTCSTSFDYDTLVTLVASAGTGTTFTGWSGEECSGTGTCQVTMSQARSVTATFALNTYELTVSKSGTGTGTVTSSPAGINCGSTCSTSFGYGTVVTLSASAGSSSRFLSWSGACSGTGTCQVTMDQARSVTAGFELMALTVSKVGTGAGTVTSSPVGINCGSTCSTSFDYNTVVTLSASASTGSTFTGWSGACTGGGTCQVTMDHAQSVTATFTLNTYLLSVSKAGTGTGTLTSSPAGINCGATCSTSFDYNTVVTLSAIASMGSTFAGWSGEGCTGTGSCQVTMSQARSVTATFTLTTYLLSVSKAGTGSGTVTSSPAGITCGTTCSTSFDYNTAVMLSASAGTGSTFTGWSGEGCSGTGSCQVTMTQARSVTAAFTLNTYLLSVSKAGTGTGTVTSSPAGINCGSTCSASFSYNTLVTLSASAGTGSTFTGWSGSGCSGNGTCQVTMSQTRSVTATFTLATYLLSVSKVGSATGTVTSSPAGINCGSTCSASFDYNTVVTLSATADACSTFTGWSLWSGEGCSGTGTCQVTMTQARGVDATFTLVVSDQFVQQGEKLLGGGAVGGEVQFGNSVAVSADGNTAIVGGHFDNNGVGAAWVFTRSGGMWTQQGNKLVGTGAVAIDPTQGTSVALSADGNTAIVGGVGEGATWVFTRSGGVWTQQGNKLRGAGGGGIGSSVALSADGNTAIVGGSSDNGLMGAVWVFTRSGGVWSQQGDKLVGTGAVGTQVNQGTSVALSADGNTAVVGGDYDNNRMGAAWVFTRSDGVWTQQGSKLVGSGATGYAYQGRSVALSADGNTAMVGGVGAGTTGAAWVFTRSGGVWTQQGSKLVGAGAVGGASQGESVALSADGNTAIVGGFADNDGVGALWLFTRSGGVWTQLGCKLVGTGGVGINVFQGFSAALSADGATAIVGAIADNNDAGAAWVFVKPPQTLTVTKAGTGTGPVTSSPAGINCGSTCSTSFDYNTMVTLSASADASSTFAGWSGEGCSGTGTCQVTMTQARSVTATFTLNTYALSVTKAGTGTGAVTSSPAGINCGGTCSANFDYSTVVTLSVSAGTGSTFAGWSGEGCSGTGTCQVTMSQARSVTATFTLNTYLLTVSKAGTGAGTVTSSPAGVTCGSTCSSSFVPPTVVTLSASVAGGSTFTGWSGEGCSGTGTCQVTMDQARAVTATFSATASRPARDFDSNGNLDIVGRNGATGQWWVGVSSGSGFASALWGTWSPAVTWKDVSVGDFNGDGRGDLIGRAESMGGWYAGISGGSSFATSYVGSWSPSVPWVDVKVADFTGDGRVDIMGRETIGGSCWVGVSNGATITSTLWGTWSPGVVWDDMVAGDFNGDGKADLAARIHTTGQWYVALSNGSKFTTTLWGMWSTGVTWKFVQVGDFDGDGRDDVIGFAAEMGGWYAAVSSGSSFATSYVGSWSPSVPWVDVKVADFNGDGKADIMGRETVGGSCWVGVSNGSMITSTLWGTWSPGVTWKDLLVGDFNGDGREDLAARMEVTGQWWVALSNGSKFTTTLWGTWSPSISWVDVG